MRIEILLDNPKEGIDEIQFAIVELDNSVRIEEGFDEDDIIIYEKPSFICDSFIKKYACTHYAYELLDELSEFRFAEKDPYFSL